MIKIVQKEQEYLIELLRPTLEEIIEYKDYRKSWETSFEDFKNLVIIVNADLTYFSLILQSYHKTVIYQIINLIDSQKYKDVLSCIKKEKSLLEKAEFSFFQKMTPPLAKKKFDEVIRIMKDRGDVLEEDEIFNLKKAIEKIVSAKDKVIKEYLNLIDSGDYNRASTYLQEKKYLLSKGDISVFKGVLSSLSTNNFSNAVKNLSSGKSELEVSTYEKLKNTINSINVRFRDQLLKSIESHLLSETINYKKIGKIIDSPNTPFSPEEKDFLRKMLIHIQRYTFRIPLSKIKKLFHDDERKLLTSTLTTLREKHIQQARAKFSQLFKDVQSSVSERKGGFVFDEESINQKKLKKVSGV